MTAWPDGGGVRDDVVGNSLESLDKLLIPEDFRKMQPEYWERTWYRRLYVRLKWRGKVPVDKPAPEGIVPSKVFRGIWRKSS